MRVEHVWASCGRGGRVRFVLERRPLLSLRAPQRTLRGRSQPGQWVAARTAICSDHTPRLSPPPEFSGPEQCKGPSHERAERRRQQCWGLCRKQQPTAEGAEIRACQRAETSPPHNHRPASLRFAYASILPLLCRIAVSYFTSTA